MDTFFIMLKNVIIFVLLAVPGYLLVKGKKLSQQESGALTKLLTNVGMPFLILSSTLKLELTPELAKTILVAGILGIFLNALMFFLAPIFTRGENDEKRKKMMRVCMAFANNGFIGIPLAKAVFGEGSMVMVYLIILNIVTNVTLFTLAEPLLMENKKKVNLLKIIFTPVLIAFLVGIVLNLLGVTKEVPEVQTYATHFSNIVTPLSMVILGMKLANVPMTKLFATWRMYYVSAVRLVLYPALCVAIAMVLQLIPGLSVSADMVVAVFVAFAMPTFGLAPTFADQHKGDTEHAVVFTLGTTILSVATIPVLYMILEMIV